MFVGLLALLLFGLGLNLAGLFEVGVGLTRLGVAGGRDTYADSLMMGGLTVLVATPCTAPFMGAALGFALSQSALVGFAVFTALGIGLSAPYVVLATSSALLSRLPRAGAWMETVKQALAFPMFATVVWLVWVFGNQAGVDASAFLLLGLTLLALAGWIYSRIGAHGAARRPTFAAIVIALVALATTLQGARIADPPTASVGAASGDVTWEPYSAERLLALRAEGRPILLDFTADWCLSCKVNDRIALGTDAVRSAFAEANVALLVADWTNRNAEIAGAIASYGRSGIPLYVMYPADPAGEPEILPAVLTPGIVIDAIERAVGDTPLE
jgi:thiol:disulfide interchange protein